jgi:nitrite reductase/ring-hydroxylating ferredoxin subunit
MIKNDSKNIMKQIARIVLGIIFCLAASCEKPYNPIPRPVPPLDFSIYPNDVMYLNLNYYGGHEYFTGGVNGVVVYRLSEWEFTAFDRACPYDWDDSDAPRVAVEDDGITLRCEKCKSLFQILDGSAIDGPAKYPLRQYYTRYDGMILRVRS